MGTVGVEVECLRAGAAQGSHERRVDPRGPAELGQQHLLRAGDEAVRGAGPDALGGHEEAGIGGRLEEELQAPSRAVPGVVLRVVERADLGEPEYGARRAGRLGADGVPLAQCLGQGVEPSSVRNATVGAGQRGEEGVDDGAAAAMRGAGPGQAVAGGSVDEDIEGVGDEGSGVARAAARSSLRPRDRGCGRHEFLDRRGIETLHHRAPAGASRPVRARRVEGRQHAPAGGEVVGQRDHLAQVRDRGAVAGLVGGVVELGRVDDHRGHRPGAQLGLAARGRCGGGADQLGGGQRPGATAGQEQRDLGGRAGMDARERRGGHGERVRPRRAQCPAAPGGGPIPVLGPQDHPLPGRPQRVHREHRATLRPPPRRPAPALSLARESLQSGARVATKWRASRSLRSWRASRYELARESLRTGARVATNWRASRHALARELRAVDQRPSRSRSSTGTRSRYSSCRAM